MCYGKPSIAQGLQILEKQQVTQVVVLPLYPQFSNTTTAAAFDKIDEKGYTVIPIHHYFDPSNNLTWHLSSREPDSVIFNRVLEKINNKEQ